MVTGRLSKMTRREEKLIDLGYVCGMLYTQLTMARNGLVTNNGWDDTNYQTAKLAATIARELEFRSNDWETELWKS